MKKVVKKVVTTTLMALVFGTTLVSCSDTSFADEQRLYEQATGDDGNEDEGREGGNG